MTDHRAGVTPQVDAVMAGEMEELLNAVHANIAAAREGEVSPRGEEASA